MASTIYCRRGIWIAIAALLLTGASCSGDSGRSKPAPDIAGPPAPVVSPANPVPGRGLGLEILDSAIPPPPMDSGKQGSITHDALIVHHGNEACDYAPSA